ncbi:MAG: IPTL-CTERM sorting domain-containing protein [Planctomycetota bacterium]|jgi:hypothetical protein
MNTRIRAIIVVAAISLYFATSALAYDVQEGYTNTTGQTAYDLTKIIEGEHSITSVIHDKFNSHTVAHHNIDGREFTSIHFYNGQVADGDWTWACFSAGGTKPKVVGAFWTTEGGDIIGPAGPAFTVAPGSGASNTVVEVGNTWLSWRGTRWDPNDGPSPGDGPGDPYGLIDGTVSFTTVSSRQSLAALTDNFIDTASWTELGTFALDYGATQSFRLPGVSAGDIVVFRVDAGSNATGTDLSSIEMIQYDVEEGIPTVSEWGLIVMALLLLTAGTIVIVRRRRRVARA